MYQCTVQKRNSFSRISACLSAKHIFDLASNQDQRQQCVWVDVSYCV